MKQNQIELKGEIDKSTVKIRYFNFPFSTSVKKCRQKSGIKQTLHSCKIQPDLTDIYRAHSVTAEHTFSTTMCGTCSMIDHELGRKTGLSKF